jgi:hypothetical protein
MTSLSLEEREQSTTPLNGSMEGLAEETENCQPEVPQREVFPHPDPKKKSVNERRTGG